ncbi:hypothetical protein LIX17_01625 [Mycobacterium avium subsp. hominissuis]|jgi:hypothetical protein|uniref:Uncharacterized protein n=2 Tax=Mycobacterium avium TaxID=1764 RepID=A0A2A3L5K8_MYCAV|nr:MULTISPECIES: hypothetical protein [Mycobacteriaceae]ETA91143.1 hypothetical protein O984_18390 [Mycobacterium avium 05-4293]ETB43597.1 hypothetical protein N602_05210 [Mycobacterium avium subsp. hominissuis 10-5606]AXO25146.1 hypothetical protein DFS55_23160 [Mycobacterium avium subsp. hominissuis]ETZ44279.1 hypothetical protein L837_4405 [Mycobacterium avium MAV_061107_1842]ETZ45337.1 hypothetical protein L838_3790 [Mycobacterium avium MAV_120709_2344]
MDLSTLITVTIGTTPTQIWPAGNGYEHRFLIVQNSGDTAVFVGDDSVSANGQMPALPLHPGANLTVPRRGGLCGVVESGTGTVTCLPIEA